MARIRTIKPEFFVSEQIADVSPTCRLLFVGMWMFCDDAGIHPASARQLKMEVFPGDDFTIEQMQGMVNELLRVGLLCEYEASDGTQVKAYWQVTGWHHQKIERPRYQYPKPDSTTPRRHVDDTSATPRSLTRPETTVPETTRPKKSPPKCVIEVPDELAASSEFQSAWKAWQKHRREIHKPLTPTQMEAQLDQLCQWGVDRSVKAMRHTITKGWQGLREEEPEHNSNGSTKKTTRDYLREAGVNVDEE